MTEPTVPNRQQGEQIYNGTTGAAPTVTLGTMTFPTASVPAVYVLHENPEWMPPFQAAFKAQGVPLQEWLLDTGSLDLTQAPPPGVYWSRFSASSHTRGHGPAKDIGRAVLRWLEGFERTVVNGSSVLEFEVSKVAQYTALAAAGFDVPRTIAVFPGQDPKLLARGLSAPFITKHNQGGKGLGVRRFDSHAEFDAAVEAGLDQEPADGVLLLQEYIPSAAPFITRAEFVGGQFIYAARVDTSGGTYELCPADACQIDLPQLAGAACDLPDAAGLPGGSVVSDAAGSPGGTVLPELAGAACDLPDAVGTSDATGAPTAPRVAFTRRTEVTAQHPLVSALTGFLKTQDILVAGVEFIETPDGRTVVYDINTNTNYNPAIESDGGPSAAAAVATYLGSLLAQI